MRGAVCVRSLPVTKRRDAGREGTACGHTRYLYYVSPGSFQTPARFSTPGPLSPSLAPWTERKKKRCAWHGTAQPVTPPFRRAGRPSSSLFEALFWVPADFEKTPGDQRRDCCGSCSFQARGGVHTLRSLSTRGARPYCDCRVICSSLEARLFSLVRKEWEPWASPLAVLIWREAFFFFLAKFALCTYM